MTTRGIVAGDFVSSGSAANITFLQSGAGAVSRTVQAKERDVVSVKDFGAVGDGVTDDTAAWLLARTALQDAGGGVLSGLAGKTTCISAQILFSADDCYIDCPGMVVKPTGSTSMDGVFRWAGTGVLATPVLGTNAARGDRTISVSTLGGLVAASWLRISKTTTDGGSTYYFWTQVRSVSGSGPWTITMESALPIAFATADTGLTLSRIGVIEGGGFLSPVKFDGSVSTAAALNAVATNFTVGGHFNYINGSDFDVGTVLYGLNGYSNTFSDLNAYNSGTASLGDLNFIAQTSAIFSRNRSRNAAGFGPLYNTMRSYIDVVSEGAQAGRAVKFQSCIENYWVSEGHGASTTGVSVTNGSKYNVIALMLSNGCANDVGNWFSNQNNTDNIILSASGVGSLSYDLYLGATDIDNTFVALKTGTHYFNNTQTYVAGLNTSLPAAGSQSGQGPVSNAATSGTTVSVTAVTTEETLATITLLANRMGLHGRVRIRATFALNSTADDKTVRVKFGATTVETIVKTTETLLEVDVTVFNKASASSQGVSAKTLASSGTSTLTATTAAIATTSDVTILITGQKETAGDTLSMTHYSVEIVKT